MNKFLFICLLCAGFVTRAQTTFQVNDPKAKERVLSASFNAVKIASGIQLYLSQSNEVALAVSAAEDIFADRIKTEVLNGVLKISFDAVGLNTKKYKSRQLKVYLSMNDLRELSASAGSDVKLVNSFHLKDFAAKVSSGAIFSGTIDATSMQVNVNSGAVVNLSGEVINADITASSGAVLNAEQLHTNVCKAKAGSGAMIRVGVKKEISAVANSGGSISYYGEAPVVTRTVSSGGVVKKVK